MRGLFTMFVLAIFAATSLAGAKDIRINKQKLHVQKVIKVKTQRVQPVEPLFPYASGNAATTGRSTANRLMKTAAGTLRQVATSGNGYGWLNPMQREIDRYVGPDADTGSNIDFIALSYRGADASQIYETEVDVSAGLASGALTTSDQLNDGIGGVGGRYPCMVALDRPFPSFNQFMEQMSNGVNTSHPYTICSYGTYGSNGNSWTTPDYLMDDGWLNPTISSHPLMTQENRLWDGPVSIVKDANDIYHYVGVYDTWYSDAEATAYGVQMEKYILNAKSVDDYAADGWVYGWDDTPATDPVRIDTAEVSLPRCGVAMNSSGFGVIAGPGHLGWHNPDSGYYYNETKITYSTTSDFGHTWSDWDTVSFGDLGFPLYHHASDSIIFDCQIVGNDTICTPYDGPTFMGTNFDMDVIVDNQNTIYVIFNSMWGEPTDNGWYPYPDYSGIFIARKLDGQSWEAARIAYNNGVFVGDDQISGMSQYFFDTEPKLSMDEQNHLYASWLDRRHNQVEVSQFNRYSDPETYGSDATFKTDVYAAHSIDGGANWSDPINITDSPHLDEYELNLSLHSANQDTRGDYGRIWVAYCLADTANGDPAKDAYIELSQTVWVGEASNFNPPAAISTEPKVAKTFGLRQNYPNPFNPGTKIEFTPWKSGRATLTVYNVRGQKISELFNGQVNKGMIYQVDFDGSRVAAGIYFYRLQIGHKTDVKKMALLK